MSPWFLTICYLFCAYGACNVIVYGSGPFNVFTRLREFAFSIHPNFGTLFSCMLCMPTNFGLICSLVDWFLVPGMAFTPFNIIFGSLGGLYWILAMLCDASITSGVVWLIHQIDDKLTVEGPQEEYIEDNIINTDDITKQ